jgi:hypothetical protein
LDENHVTRHSLQPRPDGMALTAGLVFQDYRDAGVAGKSKNVFSRTVRRIALNEHDLDLSVRDLLGKELLENATKGLTLVVDGHDDRQSQWPISWGWQISANGICDNHAAFGLKPRFDKTMLKKQYAQ